VAEADLILGMGVHHVDHAFALGGERKSFLLTDYAANAETGRNISDPFGGGLEIYRVTADELEAELRHVAERLAAGEPGERA
jgi:protein-tyrosine-phosphatase